MVELVVEHSPPIVESRSGVHHLAFMVPNLRTVMAWCVEQGWPEVLWAETASGQQFAFCDARAERGHLIELYEPSAGLLGFYAMVKNAAKDWDGSDPLRSITA